MGTLLDTSVFIDLERAVRRLRPATALAEVSGRLEEQLGAAEEVAIAAITASELLHGVHRASPEHQPRREAFVEAVLAAFPRCLLACWPLEHMPASGPNWRSPAKTSGRTPGSSPRPR